MKTLEQLTTKDHKEIFFALTSRYENELRSEAYFGENSRAKKILKLIRIFEHLSGEKFDESELLAELVDGN